MIFLLRSLGASAAGAWLGAVTYVFSGVGVAEVFYPNLHPGMALLPWVVWTCSRRTGSRAGKVVFLSFLYGLLFLAGDVFTIGMAIIGSFLWIVVERERRERWRELGLLAVSLALGALLAAPQIFATALWVPDTNRAALGMQLRESFFFSIHPLRLLELIVPFPYGACWSLDDTAIWGWPVFRYKGMGMFTSLYAGAFAIVALIATRRSRAPGFRFGRDPLPDRPPDFGPAESRAFIVGEASVPAAAAEPREVLGGPGFRARRRRGPGVEELRRSTVRRRWTLAIAAALAALAGAAALFPGPVGAAAASAVGDARYAKTASERLPGAIARGVCSGWRRSWRSTGSPPVAGGIRGLARAPDSGPARREPEDRADPDGDRGLFADPFCHEDSPGRSERLIPDAGGVALLMPRARPALSRRRLHRERAPHLDPARAGLWGRGSVFNNDFDVGDFSRMQALRRLSVAAAAYRDSQAFFGSFALRWAVRFRDQQPLGATAASAATGGRTSTRCPTRSRTSGWRAHGSRNGTCSTPSPGCPAPGRGTGPRDRAARARRRELRNRARAREGTRAPRGRNGDPGPVLAFRASRLLGLIRDVSVDGRPVRRCRRPGRRSRRWWFRRAGIAGMEGAVPGAGYWLIPCRGRCSPHGSLCGLKGEE